MHQTGPRALVPIDNLGRESGPSEDVCARSALYGAEPGYWSGSTVPFVVEWSLTFAYPPNPYAPGAPPVPLFSSITTQPHDVTMHTTY